MTHRPEPVGALQSPGRHAFRALGVSVTLLLLAACSAPAPRHAARTAAPAAGTPTPAAEPRASMGDIDARFESALELMKNQQPDEAQAAFKSLAQDFPELSGALTNLGILYAQARDRVAALASFSRAVHANPNNAVALNWLGVLYRENKAYARAEQAYLQALKARPDYPAAQLNLAILYDLYLHRPEDALDAYRRYRLLGGNEPIVTAWIRELESQVGTRTASSEGALP